MPSTLAIRRIVKSSSPGLRYGRLLILRDSIETACEHKAGMALAHAKQHGKNQVCTIGKGCVENQ